MSKEPTRADHEFMADCLGTVEQRTVGGHPHVRPRQRYEHVSTDALSSAVAAGMADPIANARAQKRIQKLMDELVMGAIRVSNPLSPPTEERPIRIRSMYWLADDFTAAHGATRSA